METGHQLIPQEELNLRMRKFVSMMDNTYPDWEMAVISNDINIFYFTGTLQHGMIVIQREGKSIFWVRNNYERALLESRFEDIRSMPSFRTAIQEYPKLPKSVYLEKTSVTINWYEMFSKYFKFENILPVDRILQIVRSVKTDYEIALQRKAGECHRILMEEKIPLLLRDGITEAELGGEIYSEALKLHHHGITRFSGNNGDMILGYVSFSESSLYPTNFDGPGGNIGISPAAPIIGSSVRKLKKGDIVFVDIGIGIEGYNTDKTLLYSYGKKPDQIVCDTFEKCADIMYRIKEKLTIGNIPSEIYEDIMSSLDPQFAVNFMGYGERSVKFLGHGIGLYIDEYPIIAKGFDEPLEKNMTLAVEPKRGLEHYGTIGVEETFLVTNGEAECLTSKNTRIIEVL